MLKINFGTKEKNIDVTEIVYKKLMKQNIIFIESNDENRVPYFTDPAVGLFKSIFITDENNVTTEYHGFLHIFIDTLNNNKIYTENIPQYILDIFPNYDICNKLLLIQNQIKINFGTFEQEFPEQIMSLLYLKGDEKILEIGSNIGRNSLIISYILGQKQNNNFVTLECDYEIYKKLKHNRNINNMNFFIENSALSKRNLIQKGWDTIESDVVLEGYKKVNTITLSELYEKYNIDFDTLILDCEGSFYSILIDMPEILNNIKLIIVENDYDELYKKEYVDTVLKNNNFYVDYFRAGGGRVCSDNFFEVWKRDSTKI